MVITKIIILSDLELLLDLESAPTINISTVRTT